MITIYMTVSALVLAFKGLDALVQEHKSICELDVCEWTAFVEAPQQALTARQLDPWHLIMSFAQYTLMAPSYINVLNVYAVRRSIFFFRL